MASDEHMPDPAGSRSPAPGDRLEALFEAHHRALLAYAARRSPTLADAEDVVAEVFLVAWRRLDDMPAGDEARLWLYGVARNTIANQRRGLTRRTRLQDRLEQTTERPMSTAPPIVDAEPALEALSRLSASDQELLRLVAWEELSHAEIAAGAGDIGQRGGHSSPPGSCPVRAGAGERSEPMADMAIGEGQSEPPTIAGGTMSTPPTRDPIDELREANPLRDDQLPTDSRDRLWTRIQEARMADNTPQTDSGHTRFARWTIAASGAAVVAVAVAALTIGSAAAPPPQTGNGDGGVGTGMCIQFSFEELQARDFAFDGTVTAINGDQATFTVNHAFWGVDTGSSVTLTGGIGMLEESGVALDGGPLLVVGDRYLISGDDVFAWTCGYSQVYDEATAAEWAAAAP